MPKNLNKCLIYNHGTTLSISHNGAVEISGNNAGSGSVIHNDWTNLQAASGGYYSVQLNPVIEIAHNTSVTFSGNTAQYDVYNRNTAYISADKGQTITFQHGFKNAPASTAWPATNGGTTYIGKDAAGKTSEGGTYIFKDGGASVSMETTTATVKADGGMVFEGGTLEVSKAEFAEAAFTLESAGLTLSDVVFAGDLSVDFGYFGDENKLTLTNVTFGEGAALALSLDLDRATPMLLLAGADGSDSLTETTVIDMSKYLATSGSTSLDGVTLTLNVDGRLADGSDLVIDTAGLMADTAVTVTGYEYERTEAGKLYYSAKDDGGDGDKVPEPMTATLSLLALAALAARRRRACGK